MPATKVKRIWSGNQALQRLLVPVDDLRAHPRNPRRGDVAAIQASLERFGQQRPILALPDGTVVAGNHTLRAAREAGWTHIATVRSDLTDAEVEAYLLADNRTGDLGSYDDAALLDLLKPFYAEDALAGTGYERDDVRRIVTSLASRTRGDPDAVPRVPVKAKSKTGVVYELGSHRLMCGDATQPEPVVRLVGEDAIGAVWTDPPYGVAYQDTRGREISGDALDDDFGYGLVRDALEHARAHTRAGGAIYVAHPDGQGYAFRRAFSDAGWYHSQTLVWVKNQFVFSRQDYHWQHEAILYGWNPGAAHRWFGDRTQPTVIDDETDPATLDKKALVALVRELRTLVPGTVVREDRSRDSTLHPTMKPVNLVERQVGNSTEWGEVVYDSFAGSGTTLIAAENAGRRALLMEIDPAYCDVIRQRYADYTGQPEYAP